MLTGEQKLRFNISARFNEEKGKTMIVDKKLIGDLSAQAKANPRLHKAFDLSTTPHDASQRILNTVEPGTILPIHRHRGYKETIIDLRGIEMQHYYNDAGNKTASYELAPNTT